MQRASHIQFPSEPFARVPKAHGKRLAWKVPQLNNVFVERIGRRANPTGIYKDDGIPCVLSPEGILPGGQQERIDQLTDLQHTGSGLLDRTLWRSKHCG